MQPTYVVIYQVNTGEAFGWLCKADRISQAEDKFWRAQGKVVPDGYETIKCIAQLESPIIDAYLSLYEGQVQSNG